MKRKIAELLNVVFGFRKFLLMLIVVLIGIIFRIQSLIDGAQLVDLLKATVIGFFSANGIEHIMAVVKGGMDAKAAAIAGESAVADTDESNDEEDVK